MPADNLDDLWDKLHKAAADRAEAEGNFKRAREELVSRLCECYRAGENWEERAVWGSHRMAGTCPYFVEAGKRKI